ncbi:MAG: hypothetical protein ACHQ1D_02630 [Nitrososphaerales archaeon]
MLNNLPKRISSERLTLRIPAPLLDRIKKESDKKDLPINALINRALVKVFLREGQINVLPCISISHILFEKIISGLDNPSIEKAAKHGPNVLRKYYALQNQSLTLETVITDYFSLLSKYCGWFIFHHEKNADEYRLIFETQISSKWAEFLFYYLKSILEETKACIVSESHDNNLIIFEVTKKKKLE